MSGDRKGAIAAYKALLADQFRILGPNHPDTLHSRNNLAHWQQQANDLRDSPGDDSDPAPGR
jgi:hypothetical protein